MRKRYPSDLTDAQWEILRPVIPDAKPVGRPRAVDMREVLNTLLYQAPTGCQWDMLPHDLLPKSTVYDYFARFRDDGSWQAIVDADAKHRNVALDVACGAGLSVPGGGGLAARGVDGVRAGPEAMGHRAEPGMDGPGPSA